MPRKAALVFIRWFVWLGLIAAVIVGGAMLYLRLARPRVEVTAPARGPVVAAFYATGTLSPVREYSIHSNVEGTLEKVFVDKGDPIAQDQKLAYIAVDENAFRLRQAMAELELKKRLADPASSPQLFEFDQRLAAIQRQLEIARREEKRLRDLSESGSASAVDVDRASDRVQEMWSIAESIKANKAVKNLELDKDVQVAEAALDIARWKVDQQTILSPVSGAVLDRPISPGTRVRVNDAIMRVANIAPDDLVMRAQVDEEDKVRVRDAQTVLMTLYSFPGKTFAGRVKQVYPQADPQRRTFEVDVEVLGELVTNEDPPAAAATTTTGTTTGAGGTSTPPPAAVLITSATAGTGATTGTPSPTAPPTGTTAGMVIPPGKRLDRSRMGLFAAGMTGELAFVTDAVNDALAIPSQAVQNGVVYIVRDNQIEPAEVRLGLRSVEWTQVLGGLDETDRVVISPVGTLPSGSRVRPEFIASTLAAGKNKQKAEKAFRSFN